MADTFDRLLQVIAAIASLLKQDEKAVLVLEFIELFLHEYAKDSSKEGFSLRESVERIL